MESIAILLIAGVIYIVAKHGDRLANGYNKAMGLALVLVLIAAPFMFLIGLSQNGLSMDTLFVKDPTAPFTAILIFEIFVAIRLLITKRFPKERPEEYVPLWNLRGNELLLGVYLLAVSIGFFVCIFAFESKFWAFLELPFGIYFLIKGMM